MSMLQIQIFEFYCYDTQMHISLGYSCHMIQMSLALCYDIRAVWYRYRWFYCCNIMPYYTDIDKINDNTHAVWYSRDLWGLLPWYSYCMIQISLAGLWRGWPTKLDTDIVGVIALIQHELLLSGSIGITQLNRQRMRYRVTVVASCSVSYCIGGVWTVLHLYKL